MHYLGLKGAFDDRSRSRNHNFNSLFLITAIATFLQKFELLLHLSDSSNGKHSITILHIKPELELNCFRDKNGLQMSQRTHHGPRGNYFTVTRVPDSSCANYDRPVLKSKLLHVWPVQLFCYLKRLNSSALIDCDRIPTFL